MMVTGATSSIGRAVCVRLARAGAGLALCARDTDEGDRVARDLRVRFGARAEVVLFDAADFESHGGVVDLAGETLGGRLDGAVLCHGFMASQEEAEQDFGAARRMIDVNYTSCVSLCSLLAPRLPDGEGFLCVVSSVAGDRGRPSNFIYGSSKAGLNAYLEGLGAKLHRRGVAVVTVKPGFVDTSMTWGLPGLFLVASPDRVAADVERGIRRRRAVVYTPWFWRGILGIIRAIPGPVFRRMKL